VQEFLSKVPFELDVQFELQHQNIGKHHPVDGVLVLETFQYFVVGILILNGVVVQNV
jgi:hypothetical protein